MHNANNQPVHDVSNSNIKAAFDYLDDHLKKDNSWVLFAKALGNPAMRGAVRTVIVKEASYRAEVDAACEWFLQRGNFPAASNEVLVLLQARLGWAVKGVLSELQKLAKGERADAPDANKFLRWAIIDRWAERADEDWPTSWIKEVEATIGPR